MLTGIFTFRGRINRLQYWLGSMGIGLFVAVVLLGPLIAGGGADSAASAGAKLGLLALLAIPTIFIAFWVSLSLQARRIRDIGFNPVIVMPLWMLIAVADKLLTPGFPHLSPVQLASPSVVGALINLVGGAALCFWPGRGHTAQDIAATFDLPDRDDPSGGKRPDYVNAAFERIEAERNAPQPPRPPVSAPAPAPAFRQAAAPAGFGRRGL